jgi:hypothetical protein
VLNNNKFNVSALLLKAHIEDIHIWQIDNSTLSDIDVLLSEKINSPYLNQLYLLKPYYYRRHDRLKYIDFLKQSIIADPTAVYNHLQLGQTLNDKSEINISFNNVNIVFGSGGYFNPISIENLVNESLRGTVMTDVNYQSLRDKVSKLTS